MAVCTISFEILDPSENGIEGAMIEATLIDPVESGNSLIGTKKITQTTDSNGEADLDLQQSLQDVQIRLLIPDGNAGLIDKVYTIDVPASSSAQFNDLI